MFSRFELKPFTKQFIREKSSLSMLPFSHNSFNELIHSFFKDSISSLLGMSLNSLTGMTTSSIFNPVNSKTSQQINAATILFVDSYFALVKIRT